MTTPTQKPTPGLLYFTWANGRGEVLTAERVAELYLAKFGEPAAEVLEWSGLWWGGPRPEPEAAELAACVYCGHALSLHDDDTGECAEPDCTCEVSDVARPDERECDELLLEQEARRAVAAGWPNNETETAGAFVQEPLPL